MPHRGLWLALLLVTTAFTGCLGDDTTPTNTTEDAQPTPPSANLTNFTKVHTPEEVNQILEDHETLPGVNVTTIGQSFEDRPINFVTLGQGELELWIVGRQHGNEPTGTEAILLAIETLADPNATLPDHAPPIVHALQEHRETLLERITFLFLPIANPDGAAAYTRSTALGQDPNRDHFAFTQPSMQAMREAFWTHKPDACLDLHNEGIANTDFDAFGPIGPMLESEPEQQMLRDADLAVREVDAAGGNAGSFNENYRAPIADEYPNPTAVHPGTHDMFCTSRGAPGWTPEGAIPSGQNGIDTHPFAWSTRTHWVTIAATAFHWAGAYDATHTQVLKETLASETALASHKYPVPAASEVRIQAVWRQSTTESDHNPVPTRFTATPPNGTAIEARTPGPEQWTATVAFSDPEPGNYSFSITRAPAGTVEIRTYIDAPETPVLHAERNDTGIYLHAPPTAPGPVNVTLTDVADPSPEDPTQHGATAAFDLNGTVGERELAQYEVTVRPDESTLIQPPPTWENAGPYRFTATSGEILHMGVEDTENPAPD